MPESPDSDFGTAVAAEIGYQAQEPGHTEPTEASAAANGSVRRLRRVVIDDATGTEPGAVVNIGEGFGLAGFPTARPGVEVAANGHVQSRVETVYSSESEDTDLQIARAVDHRTATGRLKNLLILTEFTWASSILAIIPEPGDCNLVENVRLVTVELSKL